MAHHSSPLLIHTQALCVFLLHKHRQLTSWCCTAQTSPHTTVWYSMVFSTQTHTEPSLSDVSDCWGCRAVINLSHPLITDILNAALIFPSISSGLLNSLLLTIVVQIRLQGHLCMRHGWARISLLKRYFSFTGVTRCLWLNPQCQFNDHIMHDLDI